MKENESLQESSLKPEKQRKKRTDPFDIEPVIEETSVVEEKKADLRWIVSPTGKECPKCHNVLLGLEIQKKHAICPKCGTALGE